MDVTIVIATCGEPQWSRLAAERAFPSARTESEHVVRIDSPTATLAEVRNAGLSHVKTEWVCFLDADDQLEPGFVAAMSSGTADLRAPAVRYVPWGFGLHLTPSGRRSAIPRVAGHRHTCVPECLNEGNWLVIGTVARTELLREVGGFKEWPVYEDYDLWARCWKAGASIEAIPEAVYRAHVRQSSRNRGRLTSREKHAVHQDIARSIGLAVPA